jgi:hypothetical protein
MSRLGGPGGGASFSGERRPASAPLASGGSNVRSVQKTLAGDGTSGNLLGLPGMLAPRYQETFFLSPFLTRFRSECPTNEDG